MGMAHGMGGYGGCAQGDFFIFPTAVLTLEVLSDLLVAVPFEKGIVSRAREKGDGDLEGISN